MGGDRVTARVSASGVNTPSFSHSWHVIGECRAVSGVGVGGTSPYHKAGDEIASDHYQSTESF
jgi:hypothetical protein